jgi:hypothetical protein
MTMGQAKTILILGAGTGGIVAASAGYDLLAYVPPHRAPRVAG